MDLVDISTRVNSVIAEGFEIPAEQLQPQSRLREDLELDSLDAIDLLVYLEDAIEMKVDTDRFTDVKTLDDVYKLVYQVTQESGKGSTANN